MITAATEGGPLRLIVAFESSTAGAKAKVVRLNYTKYTVDACVDHRFPQV